MSQPKNVFSEFVEDKQLPKPKQYDPFKVGDSIHPLAKPERATPQKKQTTSQNPFDEFVRQRESK
jgi:hypothetical protein